MDRFSIVSCKRNKWSQSFRHKKYTNRVSYEITELPILTLTQKITHLQTYLETAEDNYADSFKADVAICLGDFEEGNPYLIFLRTLRSKQEIELWVDTLTSRIVLKFNENEEQLSDFIQEYIG